MIKLSHKFNVFLLVISPIILTACGGSGSSNSNENKQIGEQPAVVDKEPELTPDTDPDTDIGGEGGNGDSSSLVEFNAVIFENTPVTNPYSAISKVPGDVDSIVRFPLTARANINSIELADGSSITDKDTIAELFRLSVNLDLFQYEIVAAHQFDSDSEDDFYRLHINIGDEDRVEVVINIVDIQNGSAQEPLKIGNYDELKSVMSGQFIASEAGFERINLPHNNRHNERGYHIVLEQDIDASASAESPWQGIPFAGVLNGKQHVITDLAIEGSSHFVKEPDGFHADTVTVIKNLGFVDVVLSRPIFKESNLTVERVFVSGRAVIDDISKANFAPFSGRHIRRVYSNLTVDMTGMGRNIKAQGLHDINIAGLLLRGRDVLRFHEGGYANGSVHTGDNYNSASQFAGLITPQFSQLQNPGAPFYSAVSYNMTRKIAELVPSAPDNADYNISKIAVGGLTNRIQDFPSGDRSASNYPWRFVSNRSDGLIYTIGNVHADTNGDDIADGFHIDNSYSEAGLTEQELISADSFSGSWRAGNSPWNIEQGEYPVLKGMPYPHIDGAQWMSADDPGVVYQRQTYNDYLNM